VRIAIDFGGLVQTPISAAHHWRDNTRSSALPEIDTVNFVAAHVRPFPIFFAPAMMPMLD
jgi:hypothetical protein